MAGYLMAVTFKHGGTGTAGIIKLGIQDGQFPDQATAISQGVAIITAFLTAKEGIAPTNVAALVSQTR